MTKKRLFYGLIILSGILLTTLGISASDNPRERLALLAIGVLFITIGFRQFPLRQTKSHPLTCRACGKEREMAIVYETDGVCKECLLELVKIPGVLKDKADANKPQ